MTVGGGARRWGLRWWARWWLAPAPAERLAALRVLIGGYALVYVLARLPEIIAVARLPAAQFQPVGVVRVLGAPLPPGVVAAIAVATAALLAAFTAGLWFRTMAPAAALGLLWVTSYRSSWGMVFHTENLLVLHVIALACAPAADAWAIRAIRASARRGAESPERAESPEPRAPSEPPEPPESPERAESPEPPESPERAESPEPRERAESPEPRELPEPREPREPPEPRELPGPRELREPPAAGYGWPIKLLAALTAVTYVLAGIAKLRIAGPGWIDGELLRNQIAVDNLRKALLGDWTAPLAVPLLEHPSVFTAFCALTLALELGAFVSLLGGRVARLWALGAWGFHVGVVLLMNIWFPYPLLGFAFLPLLRAERPLAWWIGWAARRRTRRAAA